jgi:hypothetical protein
MKQNEARPVYRFLAGLVALLSWIVVGMLTVFSLYGQPLQNDSISKIVGLAVFAISFSWVALKGFMPKCLLRIFSRGMPVADDKELR